jgi:ParB family transcriptional regulator, chromosome partitioning protein
MTSGTFHLVSLHDISVKRDGRQRRELTDIDTLADSIRRLGLIHPIVVTRALELVAGERRFTACSRLGWTQISVQFVDELDPGQLQAIELEENVKRQDIPWQDQVQAIKSYHALRAAQTPDWTHHNTGEALGLSPSHITLMINIANEVERGNQLVIDAPQLSVAKGLVRRVLERRDQEVLDKLHESFHTASAAPQAVAEDILTVDFIQWVEGTVVPRFNMIHCDFPYGIEADNFNQGGAAAHGGYIDTRDHWHRLMAALAVLTAKFTTPSCHLMFWFAMRKGPERLYEPTARALGQMGWNINPMPLIWSKSDGTGIVPDPERGPRQIYETCFLGSKGDRKIVRAKANAYHCPTDSKFHMSTKPEPMLRHFFEMLVDENTVILDPTCGSGSALRAAESLGAKYILGLESNPGYAEGARAELARARKLRQAEALVS